MPISQELFDETVLENEDLFDLSPEEAIRETITQLNTQFSAVKDSDGSQIDVVSNSGILLSHPESEEGKREREKIHSFVEHLNFLDQSVSAHDGSIQIENSDVAEKIIESLDFVYKSLSSGGESESSLIFFKKLIQSDSIYTLFSYLGIDFEADEKNEDILNRVLSCLIFLLEKSSNNDQIRRNILQTKMTNLMPRIAQLIKHKALQKNSEMNNNDVLHLSLKLALGSCKKNQNNKAAAVRTGKILPILLDILKSYSCDDYKTITLTCHLLTNLCKFDDFTATASTAHDFAQDLFRQDIIPLLHSLLTTSLDKYNNSEDKTNNDSDAQIYKLICSIMMVQRVLAVNDEIVQALVAQGVLTTTHAALDLTLDMSKSPSMDSASDEKKSITRNSTATAALGLIRNLCGNDDIKTSLCQSSLQNILFTLSLFDSDPYVQEHGIGAMAAMSLRRPKNASLILLSTNNDCNLNNNDTTTSAFQITLKAMEKFPQNVKIQRQGALCIRNAIARQPSDIKEMILEEYQPKLEQMLRENAGRHRGSVDEAYAALRDLGIKVEMVRVAEEEGGDGDEKKVVIKKGVEQFGENQLKFSKTWEQSEDIEKNIDSLF